ncbi:MAG TPA: archaetidylserine decarboxylase [Gammaproteobacteria bacterium]
MQNASLMDKLKAYCFYILPHHFLSRILFRLTRIESPVAHYFIRWFIRHFNVTMSEAAKEHVEDYPSFNAFFTRTLKENVRAFPQTNDVIACPVDGVISQIGRIEQGRIFQAKGHAYSVLELLGGREQLANLFDGGKFATLYLSPRDYHRIHMPLSGTLKQMIYVPGRLFSVSPSTTRAVPRLFARNERVAAVFDGDSGTFALVLVGAMNVAAIETVWHGLITPPHRRQIGEYFYADKPLNLRIGQEMGRFNMGSTVIMLTPANVQWLPELTAESPIKLGQPLGSLAMN